MAVKRVHGKPITASRPRMNFTPSVRTTSSTSADAERLVRQPPMPFQNRFGVLAPVQTHSAFKAAKQFNRDYVHPAKPAKLNATAVGYPAKGYFSNAGRNPINSGYPLTGNKRVAGSITLSKGPTAVNRAFAKDRKRTDIDGVVGRRYGR